MKYLILIAFVFIGCNNLKTSVITDADLYEAQFHRYIDSGIVYTAMFDCFLRCDNDSIKYAVGMVNRFGDSSTKYYNLMYPHGNFAHDKKYEKLNCNCK